MKSFKTIFTASLLLLALSGCATKTKCHIWRGFYCHAGKPVN
ncbi:MAG: hypothetical protein VYD54_02805 [Bdellovibrionota bacterium]|nr:hypothetical protein [Bacteriovoracales bacterium]MEE2742808.1 hypothetical protein [Bdellovibrionota bacterium]